MHRLLAHMACFVSLTLASAACAPIRALLPASPTASLARWSTATVTLRPPTPLPTVAATSDSGPSATPFKHVVAQNETLLGIAALYGVSLDALLAVNPNLDPFLLSIGQELLIPGPEGTPIGALIPTTTPIPLALTPPTCYPRASGGAWCIAGIHNPTALDLENLLVEMRLHDSSGAVIQAAQVFSPLNRLPAGGTMPVAAAFPEEASDGVSASALVLSVIPAREVEARYAEPEIERTTDLRQEGGLSWLIGGTIEGVPTGAEENRTLILLTGYDDADRVVGYAVWEADPPLDPGEAREFTVRVFSLGPEIARVELTAESYGLEEE